MHVVGQRISNAVKAAPLAALLVLALFFPAAASPEGEIVIHGADTGSHLKLSSEGGRLVVEGIMASDEQVGCHFTHGHNRAVCPLEAPPRSKWRWARGTTRSRSSTNCRFP